MFAYHLGMPKRYFSDSGFKKQRHASYFVDLTALLGVAFNFIMAMKNYWQRPSVSPYKLKFICGYKIFPLKENFAQAKLKVTLVISVIRDIHICGINKIKTYLILKVGSVLTEVFTYFHVAVKIKPITLKYFIDFKKIQSHLKINSLFLKETLT